MAPSHETCWVAVCHFTAFHPALSADEGTQSLPAEKMTCVPTDDPDDLNAALRGEQVVVDPMFRLDGEPVSGAWFEPELLWLVDLLAENGGQPDET